MNLLDFPCLHALVQAMWSDNLAGVPRSKLDAADKLDFPAKWLKKIKTANFIAIKYSDQESIDIILGEQDECEAMLANDGKDGEIFQEVLNEIFDGELNNHFFKK